MNVEIWTKAAQFPEKENINGIFVAVQSSCVSLVELTNGIEGGEGRGKDSERAKSYDGEKALSSVIH
jgi:hypothetical protein